MAKWLQSNKEESAKVEKGKKKEKENRRTTLRIRWSSPTQLLVQPSLAYLWESGRDPEFSSGYGRTWQTHVEIWVMYHRNVDELVGCWVVRFGPLGDQWNLSGALRMEKE